jgi:hypothetical protein
MNDYNANTMLSDYQFLEDVTSTIGQFERQKNGDARLVKRKPYSDGGIRFKHLRQQCQRRNIQLHLMNGLKRHSENTSQFKFKYLTTYCDYLDKFLFAFAGKMPSFGEWTGSYNNARMRQSLLAIAASRNSPMNVRQSSSYMKT